MKKNKGKLDLFRYLSEINGFHFDYEPDTHIISNKLIMKAETKKFFIVKFLPLKEIKDS